MKRQAITTLSAGLLGVLVHLSLVAACAKADNSASPTVRVDAVVAADGSGDFKTVQAALDAVPGGNARPFVIRIKLGIYKEKLFLNVNKPFVHLVGESAEKTI